MASDNLDARKTALEDWIDLLSSWMIGFTWPVAVGLFMEFYAIFNPAWTREWNVIADRIGLLLVTAGVSGELAIELKTHGAERRLREVNAEIENKSNAALRHANERIATLQLETERLHNENNETAIFLGDRRIIDPIEFQPAMHAFSGATFMILHGKGRETKAFAASLRYNLEEAGWKLNQFNNSSQNEGVYIVESGFDDVGPCSAAAEALADVLNDNRVATLTYLRNEAPPWAMTVCVGDKPETPEMQKRIQDERTAQKERRSAGRLRATSRGPLSPSG